MTFGGTKARRNMALFAAHGESQPQTTEYSSWKHMMRRCNTVTDSAYKNYGGRGISVCERWRNYPNFLADMGRKPDASYTIERIDSNGHYEPGNCRWATRAEQNRNLSRTIFVKVDGSPLCLKDAAKALGIKYITVRYRMRNGWTAHEAVMTPVGQRRHAHRGSSGRFSISAGPRKAVS